MKILRYTILAAVLVSMMAACKENEALTFDSPAAIYFYRGSYSSQQQDSILQSFFLLPEDVERETIFVEVRTMGTVSDIDRPVKFVQTNIGKPGAAQPGIHYVAFDSPEAQAAMFVPAGEVSALIPVTLIKTSDMAENKYRIEMSVAENEHFLPGIDKQRDFMVQTTATAEMPASWSYPWLYYFGTWGPVKMKFIITYLDFNDFDNPDWQESGFMSYLKLKANELLVKYNEEHGEYRLCEDAGKRHPGGEACEDCVEFLD